MDYNLWQELILGATKPFRVGANVLGQNWGSALTGKDMSQRENQGQFLKWLAGGITPEEQTAINEEPYLEAIKSSAGMASTLAPFATQSLRTAQLASNPITNKFAQLLSQGALEGGLGGFGYSRDGRELQDTLTGAGLGAAGEVAFEALMNPQFRSMMGESLSANDLPGTMSNMYGGGVDLGSDEGIATVKNQLKNAPESPSLSLNNKIYLDKNAPDLQDPGPEITNYQNYLEMNPDGPTVIDLIGDDPIKKLGVEALQYTNPEDFVKGVAGKSTYGNPEVLLHERTKTTPFSLETDLDPYVKPIMKDGKIKVFRFTNAGGLLPGDFVSISENVARRFAKTGARDGRIIEQYVPLSDLGTTRNGYQVYKPNGISSLQELWKQAHGKIGRGAKDMASSLSSTYSDILKKR